MAAAKIAPFPNNLRFYRRRKRMHLAQVARAIGLSSPAHLAHWEKGRKQPSLDNLLKLAAVLEVPVEALYIERLKTLRQELSDKKSPITPPAYAQ